MAGSNLLIYFLVTSITLYYLSTKLFPKSSESTNVPIINAPAGQIRGIELRTKYGRSVSAYRVIPYAKPPIGELRFKKPKLLLKDAWEGVFDGSGTITPCVQPNRGIWATLMGSEDCLHLNVYIPQTDKVPKDGFPVMAWIHGGGFFAGKVFHNMQGVYFIIKSES